MSQIPPPPGPPGPPGPPPEHPPPGYLPPAPPPREGRNPLPLVLAGIAAVLVVALAVAVPVVLSGDDDPDPASATDSSSSAVPNLDAVRVYEDLGNEHVAGDVDYPQLPPVGGAHDPAWLDCGSYDEPVRDENAVHDLEHGATWLTYDPGLDPADVAALVAQLPQNSIASPYDGLPAPVVVTVWGRQLELDGAVDPRLGLFVAAFGDGHTAPEPFASCAGGLEDPAGSGDGTQV